MAHRTDGDIRELEAVAAREVPEEEQMLTVVAKETLLIGMLDMVDLDNLYLVSHSLIYFLVDLFRHQSSLWNLRKELTESLPVVEEVVLVLAVELVEPIVVRVVLVVVEQVVETKILQNQIIHPLLETLKALHMVIMVPSAVVVAEAARRIPLLHTMEEMVVRVLL